MPMTMTSKTSVVFKCYVASIRSTTEPISTDSTFWQTLKFMKQANFRPYSINFHKTIRLTQQKLFLNVAEENKQIVYIFIDPLEASAWPSD